MAISNANNKIFQNTQILLEYLLGLQYVFMLSQDALLARRRLVVTIKIRRVISVSHASWRTENIYKRFI